MSSLDTWLERAYWFSQIALTLVAVGAAVAAFTQVRTFKLFELLKLLESPPIRASRRVVIREIYGRKDEPWWDDTKDGERFEEAASHVCATYDVLGRMIEFDKLERVFPGGGYGSFFRRHWAPSIVRTHDALTGFLVHRRESIPHAYEAYTRLANAAGPYAALGPISRS